MLAVAVESCPLDSRGALSAPIELNFLTVMTDDQIPSFELRWQADDKRANLARRTWCVDMFTENTRRPRISLQFVNTVPQSSGEGGGGAMMAKVHTLSLYKFAVIFLNRRQFSSLVLTLGSRICSMFSRMPKSAGWKLLANRSGSSFPAFL